MKIRRKILEYFGLIDSYERIIAVEQRINEIEKKQAKRYPHLIERIAELEQVTGLKDSYIDSIVKKKKNK